MPFAVQDKFTGFIDWLSDHFQAVYWLPGNHEYYGSEIPPTLSLFEKIRSNFFLVNNQQVSYKECTLVFSTLWSKISPQYEWTIQRSLADFRAISLNGRSLTPSGFNGLHESCRSFLESSLLSASGGPGHGPTIVITHHVPTLMNYPGQYRNSPLTEAFAVELFELVENSGAGHWLYGHHHSHIPAFTIGRTELITNQLGYIRMNEQRKFRRDAVISLPDMR